MLPVAQQPRHQQVALACGVRPLATVDQKADNDGRRPQLAMAAGHSSHRPQAEVGLGGERLVGPLPEGDAGGGLRDAQQDAEGPGRRAGIWEASRTTSLSAVARVALTWH